MFQKGSFCYVFAWKKSGLKQAQNQPTNEPLHPRRDQLKINAKISPTGLLLRLQLESFGEWLGGTLYFFSFVQLSFWKQFEPLKGMNGLER